MYVCMCICTHRCVVRLLGIYIFIWSSTVSDKGKKMIWKFESLIRYRPFRFEHRDRHGNPLYPNPDGSATHDTKLRTHTTLNTGDGARWKATTFPYITTRLYYNSIRYLLALGQAGDAGGMWNSNRATNNSIQVPTNRNAACFLRHCLGK